MVALSLALLMTLQTPAPATDTTPPAVAVESPTQSVVWPFSIPVIAGEGPAQTAANKP